MAGNEAGAAASGPDRPHHRQDLGRRGEDLAWSHLEALGYRLIRRNFRLGRGELDLVVESPAKELVFVEVKACSGPLAGDPAGWVGNRKIRRLQRLAQVYCERFGELEREMRFDVVAVDLSGPVPEIVHFAGAFLPDGADYA